MCAGLMVLSGFAWISFRLIPASYQTVGQLNWFVLGFDPDPINAGSLRKHVYDLLRLFTLMVLLRPNFDQSFVTNISPVCC